MKKLLTLFSATSLFVSTSNMAISCQKENVIKLELPNQPRSEEDIINALDYYTEEKAKVDEIIKQELAECSNCSESQTSHILLKSESRQRSVVYESFIKAYKSYKMLEFECDELKSKNSGITYKKESINEFEQFIDKSQEYDNLTKDTKKFMKKIQEWAREGTLEFE
ncbi:lipoprotein [Spiroplasma endosymbiont of Cantharis rufa]|uniref:lipoprotein n=1 Tax=Spiroplasma endosymbiont of Cantharis rufa TaxID=3066279 RepID=UPI0030CD5B42